MYHKKNMQPLELRKTCVFTFYKDLIMLNIKTQLLRSFQKVRIFPRSHQASLCNIKK